MPANDRKAELSLIEERHRGHETYIGAAELVVQMERARTMLELQAADVQLRESQIAAVRNTEQLDIEKELGLTSERLHTHRALPENEMHIASEVHHMQV